jgi:hypothetical protein
MATVDIDLIDKIVDSFDDSKEGDLYACLADAVDTLYDIKLACDYGEVGDAERSATAFFRRWETVRKILKEENEL